MVETTPEHYVFSPMPTIFDMREDFSSEGSIRVVTHYIGDEDEEVGEIRAMAEVDEDEEHEMVSIIIDSGADAPIFPSAWRSAAGGLVRMKEGRFFKMLKETEFYPRKREVEIT